MLLSQKDVLVSLCENSFDLSLPVIKTADDYQQSVAGRQTVTVGGRNVRLPDCNKLVDTKWSDDLRSVPNFEWPHVVIYLMETCGWTSQQVANYKDTRAFFLHDNNHVDKLLRHTIEDFPDFCYVKAMCTRQTSFSEKPYKVWVLLKKDSTIQAAGCECTG